MNGTIIRLSSEWYEDRGKTITYYVDIGNQEPRLGHDPELAHDKQILADVQWLALHEIPERDRAYIWAAGLIGISDFNKVIELWGNDMSWPSANTHITSKI